MTKKDSHQVKSQLIGVTGVILAGGKSSRFGRNKAFVEIDGTRLIERVARLMGSIFKRLIIISNTPREYSYLQLPVYVDLIKGLGPIGGIYTGLEVIEDDAGFFVACDMPFINEGLVRYIIDVRDDFDAVVPRINRLTEPLHALYSKSCLPAVRKLIRSGNFQTAKSYEKIRVRFVEEMEIRAFDPMLKSFMNINRPDELLGVMSPKEDHFN